MEEKEIREIKLGVAGNPIGSVRKVYSTTATLEGDTSELRKLWKEGDAKRKELEARWKALPEDERKTCYLCLAHVAALLSATGVQILSSQFEQKVTGKKFTVTIKIEENADQRYNYSPDDPNNDLDF